jgi:hypothetical protein
MKLTAWLRTPALALACVGLLIPSPVVAATTVPAETASKGRPTLVKTFDVELLKGGMLVGQIVDGQGVPQPKAPVSLIQGNKTLTTATTNRGGFFAVKGVPAGTYQVAAGKTQGVYRVWAPGTAPPGAQRAALMVVGQGPARAQQCNGSGPLGYWLSNPWVIAGLIAAAVAIPVAIHNHQIDNDHPASN